MEIGAKKRGRRDARLAIGMRHNAKMEDVASGAHAAIIKRDWDALQPLLNPYLHWMQADGPVVRGRTKVIGMLQAIGISGPRRPSSCATARSTAGTSEGAPIPLVDPSERQPRARRV